MSDEYTEGYIAGYEQGYTAGNPYIPDSHKSDEWYRGHRMGNGDWLEHHNLWQGVVP